MVFFFSIEEARFLSKRIFYRPFLLYVFVIYSTSIDLRILLPSIFSGRSQLENACKLFAHKSISMEKKENFWFL